MLQRAFHSMRRIWTSLEGWGGGVLEGFSEEGLFELGAKEWGLVNWVKGHGVGEEIISGGNSMCKGPEAGKNLEHLGNWKKAGSEPLSIWNSKGQLSHKKNPSPQEAIE